ncbi:integrase catalytic domain-containing protein [Trichonephila clavipes]|nr:integrase catalytic domain-containing protein [Trichonephila clavipes]
MTPNWPPTWSPKMMPTWLYRQDFAKFSLNLHYNNKISDLLLENTATAAEYEADFEGAEDYRDNFFELKSKIETLLNKDSGSLLESSSERNMLKLKLPKFELKMFSGDPKEYLTFWSIFSKIHDSEELTAIDKFQYLYQSMEPDLKAARLISSFPITAENYPKAVKQLKLRFGRQDLLVQIYVHYLLSLVLKNATTGKNAPDLATLYDKLETKLRALESLGRTKEKFADFLEPLVESCLPENVLREWERRRISESTDDATSQRSLEKLMCFLRHEVESEEMIRLAREGFGKDRVGHLAKRCHSRVRCLICKRRHYPLLCPDLRKEKETNFSSEDRTTDNEQKSTETLLTNLPSEHEIYLKTIMIRLRNRDKEVCVRALLDDESQRSYIEKNLAAELFLSPSGREIFSQGLFGGGISPASEHKRYMLASRGTKLTDVGRDSPPIRVLLGADILGSILTGRIEVLSSGVSAVETLQEAVPIDQLAKEVHCLPHRPVAKPSSNTTKVRPVFDASFKKPGFASDNECLSVGPSLIHKILPLLLRFRFSAIGVIADVKQAFIHIRLRTEDRDVLRFLWWENEC